MFSNFYYNINTLTISVNDILWKLQDDYDRVNGDIRVDELTKEITTLIGKVEQIDQVLKSIVSERKSIIEEEFEANYLKLIAFYNEFCLSNLKESGDVFFKDVFCHNKKWEQLYPFMITTIGRVLSSYDSIIDIKEIFERNGIVEKQVLSLKTQFVLVKEQRSKLLAESGIHDIEIERYDKMILKLIECLHIVKQYEMEKLNCRIA
ncbi:hypothetical protein K4L44_16925 [Halosquirtibacter laminarini]|uniref:Uncharacterized protein n=1 Tax=Halosquirtibacter laminarini TaxID=3374600 RepID=A0AC61NR19_9BACT|nr:hypothetical protein K4L44_16925 [Prolixibacteraceae bacterium]